VAVFVLSVSEQVHASRRACQARVGSPVVNLVWFHCTSKVDNRCVHCLLNLSLGGTGRVVTFCYLGCLKVSKDKAPALNSQFSARRLILRHESMDPVIPGVFSTRGVPRSSAMIRSRMDLWFENDDSANTALEAFIAKIYLERGRRGGHLRCKLIEMSNQ